MSWSVLYVVCFQMWSVINTVGYEHGLLWTGLLGSWSVLHGSVTIMVCYERGYYERGLLWTRSAINGSVMNMICYERVCYELVCFVRCLFSNVVCYELFCHEHGLLWTGLLWTAYLSRFLCEELFMSDARPHIAKLILKQFCVVSLILLVYKF